MTEANELYRTLADAVQHALGGHREVIELLAVALFARGHVVIGGRPTGESAAVAAAFARGLGLSRKHLRLTPDLDRAKILDAVADGLNGDGRGRLFPMNVLQADGLNRAPPEVQSVLVEAMDGEILVDPGETITRPRPFMVIATLTPIESEEVYGLPVSHRDAFLFELQIDDLNRDEGLALLDRDDLEESIGADAVKPVAEPEDVLEIQEAVGTIHVDDSIKEYLLDTIRATHEHPDVEHGASTWSSLSLLRAVKSYAAVSGREYAIPDDVKSIAGPALVPRLVLTTEAELDDADPRAVVADVLDSVVPPGTEFEADAVEF